MGTTIIFVIVIVDIVTLGLLLNVLRSGSVNGKWFWLVRDNTIKEEEEPPFGVFPYGKLDENGVICGLEEPPPDQQSRW